MSEFRQRCKEVARRFLQTVVIVDDEAYTKPAQSPGVLKTPTRHTVGSRPSTTASESPTSAAGEMEEKAAKKVETDDGSHSLDTGTLVESFSRQGLICAVVAPRPDTDPSDIDIVAPSVKRTDIVILDWRLNGDEGQRTLSILESILKGDAGERLRLIAIYTGEQGISEIGQIIVKRCAESEWKFEGDKRNVELSYRHCRIVIYSKSVLPVESGLPNRTLSESDLPDALIEDFSAMAQGLLPNIALMSLAAVRENVHKVLDRFDSKLDPALLTHRACLPIPDDSQQHMVSQLASELHAIMDDAVATDGPAGMDAIREWLDFPSGVDKNAYFGGEKKQSRDQTVALLEKGLETDDLSISKKRREKAFRFLTKGFSGNENSDGDENPEHQLDLQLAWMFNFRTVFDAPSPILQLGTVLQKPSHANAGDANASDASGSYFLCMRPRCDSVRLQEKTAFLLLPLLTEPKPNSVQLVLHTGGDTYRRVSVCMETSQWSLVNFVPDKKRGSVIAESRDSCFYFTGEEEGEFRWLGELKADFAQRVAQEFAAGLSRVPINNSEWLRRKERHG